MAEPVRRMEGWTQVSFGDVVRKVSDRVDPKTAGLKRYVAGEHMDSDDLRIRRWGVIGDDYLGPAFHMRFKPGQVLYGSRRTYLRKVAVPGFEGITANTTFVLESKDPTVLLPELLPFIMQSASFHEHSIKQSKGSVNPYVNFSDLAWYEFALPPLEEQHRLAEALLAVGRADEALHDLRERGYRAWKSISFQELGPRAGRGEPLSRHYEITSGQVDPSKTRYRDLPLVAPDHIQSDLGELKGVTSAGEQGAVSGKYEYPAGAVLYSKIRPELRKAALAPFRGLCSADIYPLLVESTVRAKYLLEILLSEPFVQFAVSGSRRSAIPKINRSHLSSFEFALPGLREQDAYLATVGPLRESMAGIDRRRANLSRTKTALLSGELK